MSDVGETNERLAVVTVNLSVITIVAVSVIVTSREGSEVTSLEAGVVAEGTSRVADSVELGWIIGIGVCDGRDVFVGCGGKSVADEVADKFSSTLVPLCQVPV